MNICIIGNSERAEILYQNLINKGYESTIYRTWNELPTSSESDYVVLPIPTTKNKYFLNMEERQIRISELAKRINKNSFVITCNCTFDSHKYVDINKREDFTYLNAIPTAEGSIELAIRNSEKSIAYSSALITGFGHVGKVLADKVKWLFKNVTIAARSDKDIFLAKALGYETINMNLLSKEIQNYDIVFQTVPALIINENVVKNMKKDSFIIELSSGSVGTDAAIAEEYGIRIVHAPALPAKVSPVTAGDILSQCVTSIITNK
jgi:dipicolinate synthase subunit A